MMNRSEIQNKYDLNCLFIHLQNGVTSLQIYQMKWEKFENTKALINNRISNKDKLPTNESNV
jgi:hypothetical protein